MLIKFPARRGTTAGPEELGGAGGARGTKDASGAHKIFSLAVHLRGVLNQEPQLGKEPHFCILSKFKPQRRFTHIPLT